MCFFSFLIFVSFRSMQWNGNNKTQLRVGGITIIKIIITKATRRKNLTTITTTATTVVKKKIVVGITTTFTFIIIVIIIAAVSTTTAYNNNKISHLLYFISLNKYKNITRNRVKKRGEGRVSPTFVVSRPIKVLFSYDVIRGGNWLFRFVWW